MTKAPLTSASDDAHARPSRHRRLLRESAPFAVAIIIIAILELFVFNMPYWQTRNATPQPATEGAAGPGLTIEADGTAYVTDPETAYRDLSSDEPIDYLYVNPGPAERSGQGNDVRWSISTMKDTDGGWYDANAIVGYSPSSDMSRYSHVGGGATHVRIRYQMDPGGRVPFTTYTVNPRVPMSFDMRRLALELLIAAAILAFRPGSRLHRRAFSMRDKACAIAVVTLVAVECAVVLGLFSMAAPPEHEKPAYWDFFASYQASDQYRRMGESLLAGRADLDYPVNPDLAAMSNPYDTRARTDVALSNRSVPVYFDVAFHDGRYYSYFGVLPALVMFAPFRAITGMNLRTNTAIGICAVLVTITSMLLVIQIARLIIRRGGTRVHLGAVLIAGACAFLGTGVPILIQLGYFYQIPQELAMALAMGALACWIESKLRGLSLPWLAGGSLFMALTVASRPQTVLATFIAIPLFWDDISRMWIDGVRELRGAGGMLGKLGKRVASAGAGAAAGRRRHPALLREARVWLCVIVPYLAVIIPQLAYNHARFGSLFDFGANYNLTGYDMTNFHAPLAQYVSFTFYYFLQPPNLTAQFPFVNQVGIPVTTWRSEHPNFGGFLMTTAPFALLLFVAPLWMRMLRRIRVAGLFHGSLVAALLIYLINARITGVDFRYEIDFTWAIMMAFTVLLLVIDAATNPADEAIGDLRDATRYRTMMHRLVIGFLTATIALALAFLFFKQFMDDMNMPTRTWWDTAAWFTFM